MSKSLKQIMREIAPERQHRELVESQGDIHEQLKSIIAQLRQQSDSTFGGQSWSKAGVAGFGDRLKAHSKALDDLGDNFNSGKLPKWALDQQSAYKNSAIGQSQRRVNPSATGNG